jgi:protein O-GlcNAc transferase
MTRLMGNQVFKSKEISEAESLHRAGNLAKAETVYCKILQSDPEHGEALRLFGLLAHQTGHSRQAAHLISRAVKAQPENIEAHFNLGIINLDQGLPEDAVTAFEAALAIDPTNFSCLVNLGNALIAANRFENAAEQSTRALEIDINNVEALSNLGQALSKMGQLTKAMTALRRAVLCRPNDARLLNNLGNIEQTLGLLEYANQTFEQALKIDPKCKLAERNILINTLNLPHQSAESLFEVHELYGEKYNRKNIAADKFAARNKDINRKLRVGYLSSDFHSHPVGYNVLPLISNHDTSEVEIFIYSECDINDEVSNQFRYHADHWYKTTDQSDAQVANKITDDEIDILVSLAGRFNLNRPTVTTFRTAPIQISYHDCATSGLTEMDYWLTDTSLHPANTPELFTEELYRLPTFYQFAPPVDFPAVSELPIDQKDFLTFGSFNKPEKINDHVIALWADVLASVPHSKLYLKYRDYFNDPALILQWQNKFGHFGITEDRLIFNGNIENREDHLGLYQHIDIALDPFPFNGATTTFEALAMGVPVITLEGKHFVDRVAGSLLAATGLNEMIARSHKDYICTARTLAGNIEELRDLRQNLRPRLIKSPLCQAVPYAKSIEIAYREMWRRWCGK